MWSEMYKPGSYTPEGDVFRMFARYLRPMINNHMRPARSWHSSWGLNRPVTIVHMTKLNYHM